MKDVEDHAAFFLRCGSSEYYERRWDEFVRSGAEDVFVMGRECDL